MDIFELTVLIFFYPRNVIFPKDDWEDSKKVIGKDANLSPVRSSLFLPLSPDHPFTVAVAEWHTKPCVPMRTPTCLPGWLQSRLFWFGVVRFGVHGPSFIPESQHAAQVVLCASLFSQSLLLTDLGVDAVNMAGDPPSDGHGSSPPPVKVGPSCSQGDAINTQFLFKVASEIFCTCSFLPNQSCLCFYSLTFFSISTIGSPPIMSRHGES